MPRLLPALAAALFAVAALSGPAEAETSELDFAADRYLAGSDIEVDTPTEGDLFAASEDLALEEPVTGATHLAARRLTIDADTGTLYAFAYEIDLEAMVAGAASLFAAEVALDGEIGGNLRLFARDADVRGALNGSALIAARDLSLDAPVAGDLMLAVESVEFGDDATVAGQVIVYVEDGEEPVEIPARVAGPDRRHHGLFRQRADRRRTGRRRARHRAGARRAVARKGPVRAGAEFRGRVPAGLHDRGGGLRAGADRHRDTASLCGAVPCRAGGLRRICHGGLCLRRGPLGALW